MLTDFYSPLSAQDSTLRDFYSSFRGKHSTPSDFETVLSQNHSSLSLLRVSLARYGVRLRRQKKSVRFGEAHGRGFWNPLGADGLSGQDLRCRGDGGGFLFFGHQR